MLLQPVVVEVDFVEASADVVAVKEEVEAAGDVAEVVDAVEVAVVERTVIRNGSQLQNLDVLFAMAR
jgi:hypothetical protein